MDWTSLGISGQTAGYSLFALLSSGPRMSAEQYRLGESKSVLALKQRVLEAKKDDRLLHEVAGH
jgi:hypothetical protein